MEVLALADDLTGALEVGAKFAAHGIEALVTTGGASDAPALVIDTETRHLEPREAAERVKVSQRNCRLIYKKTDSTLRGNIGAELGALLAMYPDSPLIYVPAYPKLGRTVKRGHLHVHGALAHQTAFANDALNPVSDSDILSAVRSQTDAPVFSITVAELRGLSPGAIYVCDGESDEEITQAARLVCGRPAYRLAAGPAAFAEAIAEQIDLPRNDPQPWPAIHSCLVINGSRHELSRDQVCHAKTHGWKIVNRDSVPELDWVILDGAVVGGAAAFEVAENVGAIAREILTRVRLDALTIFGGDTAYGILKAIGSPALRPVGEIVPGVPLSKVEGRNLYLITKAGGFGDFDVLCAIRGVLTGN